MSGARHGSTAVRSSDRVFSGSAASDFRLRDRSGWCPALVLRAAAEHGDDEALDGCLSSAALTESIRSAERAASEALHFFGGYGYALEYDVHLYLRFVKAYAVLHRDPELGRDLLESSRRQRRVATAGRTVLPGSA